MEQRIPLQKIGHLQKTSAASWLSLGTPVNGEVEKDGVNMDTDIGELIERTHVLVDRHLAS